MYPVPDDDLDLLECYLDDALDEAQSESLRLRLAKEPSLAAALRQLRDERAQRQAFFQSIDPTPAEVDAFVAGVKQSSQRTTWWHRQWRWAKLGSALAACVVAGMLIGDLVRTNAVRPGTAIDDLGAPIVNTNQPPRQTYAVEVTDEAGRVIAVQHFENPSEATDFANDLRKLHAPPQRPTQNGVILVGDEF